MKEYLDAAPHPFCNSVGQDYYESGLVPSATDFQVFKDFGHPPASISPISERLALPHRTRLTLWSALMWSHTTCWGEICWLW